MSIARSKRDRNGTPSSSGGDGEASGNDGNYMSGTPVDESNNNSSSSGFNRLRSDSTSIDISPSNDLNTRRGGKRAKYLSPTDRKAFYSIVSLLIDRTAIPSDEIVTIDNWEKFIAADKMNYVEKLKDILQYDC